MNRPHTYHAVIGVYSNGHDNSNRHQFVIALFEHAPKGFMDGWRGRRMNGWMDELVD